MNIIYLFVIYTSNMYKNNIIYEFNKKLQYLITNNLKK